jgi:hypothetical protein
MFREHHKAHSSTPFVSMLSNGLSVKINHPKFLLFGDNLKTYKDKFRYWLQISSSWHELGTAVGR